MHGFDAMLKVHLADPLQTEHRMPCHVSAYNVPPMPSAARSRGLCSTCCRRQPECVRHGKTTWAELERQGLSSSLRRRASNPESHNYHPIPGRTTMTDSLQEEPMDELTRRSMKCRLSS